MTGLKSNWRGAALNLLASSTLIFVLTQGSADWNSHTFDIELESGRRMAPFFSGAFSRCIPWQVPDRTID